MTISVLNARLEKDREEKARKKAEEDHKRAKEEAEVGKSSTPRFFQSESI